MVFNLDLPAIFSRNGQFDFNVLWRKQFSDLVRPFDDRNAVAVKILLEIFGIQDARLI